jgi:hypothetical protein
MKPVAPDRTDPRRDARRLMLYFGGLILVYVIAVIAFWNAEAKDGVFIAIMFAPTVGALLARFAGPGVIQWGRPSWWIFAGLIPTGAVLLVYTMGTVFGVDSLETPVLLRALIAAPIAILSWYGTKGGILAFTVAIIGFTLFVGVLTDRSRSVWPSVVAHGGWNALVATGFAVTTKAGIQLQAFTGSTTWVGEFGWLAALSTIALGIGAAIWHLLRSEHGHG